MWKNTIDYLFVFNIVNYNTSIIQFVLNIRLTLHEQNNNPTP